MLRYSSPAINRISVKVVLSTNLLNIMVVLPTSVRIKSPGKKEKKTAHFDRDTVIHQNYDSFEGRSHPVNVIINVRVNVSVNVEEYLSSPKQNSAF